MAVGVPQPARSSRTTITLNPCCRNFGLSILAPFIQLTLSAQIIVNTWVMGKISKFYIVDDSIIEKLKTDEKEIMSWYFAESKGYAVQGSTSGKYQRIDQLNLPEGTTEIIYLERNTFALHLILQVFTNEDGSTSVRYLVTSTLTLDSNQIIASYQRVVSRAISSLAQAKCFFSQFSSAYRNHSNQPLRSHSLGICHMENQEYQAVHGRKQNSSIRGRLSRSCRAK